jgi:hypothetical protein
MKLDLTDQEIQSILNVLGEVKWRDANPLITKIAMQIKEQETPDKTEQDDG